MVYAAVSQGLKHDDVKEHRVSFLQKGQDQGFLYNQ